MVCNSRISIRVWSKPGPPFRLIGPTVEQARGAVALGFINEHFRLPERTNQREIVFAELGEHVGGRYEFGIIILDRLPASDVSDRPQGGVARLAKPLDDVVNNREDFRRPTVQQ